MTESRTPPSGKKTGPEAGRPDAATAETEGTAAPKGAASTPAEPTPAARTGADDATSSPAGGADAAGKAGAPKPEPAKAAPSKATPPKADAPKADIPKAEPAKPKAAPAADDAPPAARIVTPTDHRAQPRDRVGRAALGVSILALVLVVVGGVVVTAAPDRVRTMLGAAPATVEPALSDRIAALEQRLDQGPPDTAEIERRLGAVESGLGSLEDDRLGERIGALEDAVARLEALTETVSKLEAELSRTNETVARIGPLENRLANVEGAARNLSDRAAIAESRLADTPTADAMRLTALALADAQLADALDAGRSFEGPLGAIRALGRGDGEITDAVGQLAPHAADGVPTRDELIARFQALVPTILQAAETKPAEGDVVGGVLAELRGLVTVRRTGQEQTTPAAGAPEGDADLTVAAIERRLKAGDLAGAVARAEELPPAAAERAAAWTEAARARLAVEQAAAALGDAVAARFEAGARETAAVPAAGEAGSRNAGEAAQ
ncbi:mitofilin family membrane protein [Tistrella mobilis]|uniref:COG4223 family protein n=1 Tax=Tistrella mobilis TaxID=171437 RepID=UPI0035573E08